MIRGFIRFAAVRAMLCILLVVGCTERKGSPVGIDLIDESEFGELFEDIPIYAVHDTSFEEVLNTGSSSQLIVGSEGETVLRSLLRFESLPEADSVLRATVKLKRSSGYSVSSFEVMAYVLTGDWKETQVTWETASIDSTGDSVPWGQPGGDFDPIEVGMFSFSDVEEDTLFEMDLPAELIKGWIDGSVPNNGVILVSSEEGSDFMLASLISRQSEDGTGEPTIEVEYITEEEPESTFTDEFLVTNDAFIYDFQGSEVIISPARGDISLGDVPAFRTMLRFDFTEFDSTWTIIRADLHLHVSDSTHFHGYAGVEAYAVLDSVWSGPDTEIDNAILGSVTVSPGDTTLELNLTGMVQLWVSRDFENNGVILKMGRTTDVFGFLELYGVASSVQDNRPSLRIFYHKPGEPPFDQGKIEEKESTRVMK